MFKGEKTTTFWIGLLALGYSIFQFCQAIWQTIYYYFIYPEILGVSSDISSLNFTRLFATLGTAVPSFIGGIIFLVIGLYIMKVSVKKQSISSQEVKQTS
jgi:hypothetical protein